MDPVLARFIDRGVSLAKESVVGRQKSRPSVVMAVVGWSDFSAIEQYLNQPTESVINEAFEAVGR